MTSKIFTYIRIRKRAFLPYLKKNFPLIYLNCYLKPRGFFSDYRDERKLERGNHVERSNSNSIILFTTHKAASTFLAGVLNKIAQQHGLIPIDFDSYFSTINNKKYQKFEDVKWLKKAFSHHGYFYGAFRSFRKIPDLNKYKVLLVLRDPRDVLTSNYYSLKFSHIILSRNAQIIRKKLYKSSIDDFVIEQAAYFKPIYQEYIELLWKHSFIFFSKYEDIIQDFPLWLNQLFDYLDLNDKNLLDEITSSVQQSVSKKEDKYSHRRKVTPGDHKDKLKPETIEYLNNYFHDELNYLNYLSPAE